jgi:endonuclease V-like protein UPF0215 family
MTLKSRIRQVKREIRALGIVAKGLRGGGGLAVGVIFRGGLYLDGVIKAKAHGPDITGAVAEMIKASPHYPQIRVLLINEALIDKEARIDPSKLHIDVMRPLILLSERGPDEWGAPWDASRVELGGKPVTMIPFGLGRREAERILMITTRDDVLPEPIRVAELICSALIGLDEQKV